MSRRRKFETVDPLDEYGLKSRMTKRGIEMTTKKVRLRLPNNRGGPSTSAEPSPGPSVASAPAAAHIQLPPVEVGEALSFEFTFESLLRSGKVGESDDELGTIITAKHHDSRKMISRGNS